MKFKTGAIANQAFSLMTSLNPGLVQCGVLDALQCLIFGFGRFISIFRSNESAVNHMDQAVMALNDRWIMVSTGFVILQLPYVIPTASFILGNGDA